MINVAISDKPRITITSYTAQDLQSFAESTLAFAVDLYHALRKQDGNLFFSPHIIYQALGMMYAGARGQTEKEITETLHITLPQDRLHAANNSLSIELSRRGENARGIGGKSFQLNIVNVIWGQQDYTFIPEYLDTLVKYYGTGIYLLDFINAPEPSRLTIKNVNNDMHIINEDPRRFFFPFDVPGSYLFFFQFLDNMIRQRTHMSR